MTMTVSDNRKPGFILVSVRRVGYFTSCVYLAVPALPLLLPPLSSQWPLSSFRSLLRCGQQWASPWLSTTLGWPHLSLSLAITPPSLVLLLLHLCLSLSLPCVLSTRDSNFSLHPQCGAVWAWGQHMCRCASAGKRETHLAWVRQTPP